jgi:FeS assembly SUF system regulator
MLRLSKLTDYGVVILSFMAKDRARVLTSIEIAAVTGIALPTVSKLLKVMVNSDLLVSVRGAKGGYLLARLPADITVASIITVLEGPIALTECSLSKQACEQATGCDIKANWHLINQTVHNALDAITLADLVRPVLRANEITIPIASLYHAQSPI